MADLIVRGRKVMTPEGIQALSIVVADGRIMALHALDARSDPAFAHVPVVDAGDCVVLPGLVDTHVHVNEPGRTEWEGFATATRAAAAGGVTTLFDMPLNSIPATTSADALTTKRATARGQCVVDVGLWGGVVAGNAEELEALHQAGVPGFKCFLVPSGVDEFPWVTLEQVRAVAPRLAAWNTVLLVHAELPGPLDQAAATLQGDPRHYATYLASRPESAEIEAIEGILQIVEEFGMPAHIVHLASGRAVELLADARARGLAVTAETCPHYLYFASEDVPHGATAYKCAPPIREAVHRDLLWEGLETGVLDMVVTDHSPCVPNLKVGDDFLESWGGITSLQLGLAITWTRGRQRGIPLERLVAWMAEAPARLGGVADRKGRIAVGHDADFAFFDPDATFRVHDLALHHRHPQTPYRDETLTGQVRRTYLRGELVYDGTEFLGEPRGRLMGDPNDD